MSGFMFYVYLNLFHLKIIPTKYCYLLFISIPLNVLHIQRRYGANDTIFNCRGGQWRWNGNYLITEIL